MLKHLVHRPVGVAMALMAIVVLGLVAAGRLPVSLMPDVDAPYITVQASESSLSAREMQTRVVEPLRQEMMQLAGLEDLSCEATDGRATVRLLFSHGQNMDYLLVEVNEKLDRALSSLPQMERPRVYKSSATDIPAFFIQVTRTDGADYASLSRYCREVLSRRLEQLPQVAMIDLSGLVEKEILILPDGEKMTQAGLSMADVEALVRSANIQLGSLTIRDGQYYYPLRFDSVPSGADDIAGLWIRSGNRLLQLKDVATVREQEAARAGQVRQDGKEAVSLAVIKQADARMEDLRAQVNALLLQIKEDYPSLAFTITRDQTELLDYSIHSLIWSILISILLATGVVFFFMQDFRSPALIALTIPSSLVLSLLLFYLVGLSINIISLSGLLLGVGMMVDNAIILTDNITGRWQRGDSLMDAVVEGTREVTGPMLSSVLTTCAVFIPLIFVKGIAGALFFDEAVSITIVLLASYVLTLVIIPVFYYQWNKGRIEFLPHPLLTRFRLLSIAQDWDHRVMKWWLSHRRVAWWSVGLSAIGLVLCLFLMERSRLPRMTRTEAVLTVDWNESVSLEENARRLKQLEELLGGNVLSHSSLIGEQQFLLEHSGRQEIRQAQLYYRCASDAEVNMAGARLQSYLSAHYPLALSSVSPVENVLEMVFSDSQASLIARLRPSSGGEVKVNGLQNLLKKLRQTIGDEPLSPIPLKKEMVFVADPARMALYDVSYEELADALRNAVNQNRLYSLSVGNRKLPVVTGTRQDDLSRILMNTRVGRGDVSIPVSALMRQSFEEDFQALYTGMEGAFYPLAIQTEASRVGKTIKAIDETVRSDGSFDVSYGGSWFSNRDMMQSLLLILLLSLSLLYLILAIQFESLLQPLIILMEVVIDLFAAAMVLWLLGESLNLMSLIGMVVVTGIVINDSILKLDAINRLRGEGVPCKEAVLLASSRRMKAILMTSLTTILAVAPFLVRGSMGADLQYPLSLVVISGMVVGTLVSLFVVPALYASLYDR